MTYFQNPFHSDFMGNWVIDDRNYAPTFKCPLNSGRGDEIVTAWEQPTGSGGTPRTYDLSGNDSEGNDKSMLVIRFALGNFLNWSTLTVDLTSNTNAALVPAPTAAAIRADEIRDILNAEPTFAQLFEASLGNFDGAVFRDRLTIRQKLPATRLRFYIVNGQAESVLKFNARAGVAELPTYFSRHTVFNRNLDGEVAFADGANLLVELDETNSIDADVIDSAVDARGVSLGLDSATVQADWQLLEGKSPTFLFTKISGATTIVYPAGAKVGDLAKMTVVSGGNIFIMPYTLTSGDLISPP